MKRFCQECGKEARQGENVCIHCGTPFIQNEENVKEGIQNKQVVKEPMPKKRKRMWQVIVAVFVIVIGFSIWANSYHSPKSVQKRFDKAIIKEDSDKIQKLIIHSDGSSVNKSEAEAFLTLVKEEGKTIASDLTDVVYTGKFLGIYEKYKMESVDQFAANNKPLEGLSFTFNGTDTAESEQEDELALYGPLLPGIYNVEALFESDYGDATVEESLTLRNNTHGEYELIDLDIPIDYVTFHIENYENIDLEDSYIEFNDKKLPIMDEGQTKEIGPLLIDGSQQITIVASLPWGEVTSEPVDIDDNNLYVNAELITQEDYDEVLDVLSQFGEEYVESMAVKSTKPFKSVTSEGKEILKSNISNYDEYTGQLDLMEADKDSMSVDTNEDQTEVKLHTQFHFQNDYHEITETPDLSEEVISWVVGLSYNKEDSKWVIASVNHLNSWNGLEATDERKGSGKPQGPSKEAISSAEDNELEAELEEFVFDYTSASIEAINYRDFDLVSTYIEKDGPRYKEADDYIDYLDSKDIYEEWYGSELEKVEKEDDDTWKVTVIEEFEIIKPDSSDIKKYRTILIIKQIDNEFYVNKLTETNEI